MTKLKTALIFIKEKSEWQSCNYILENLFEAYRKIDSIELLEIPLRDSSKTECQNAGKIIGQNRCDKIVILDHRFRPFFFVHELLKLTHSFELIVHVYGDFFLNLARVKIFDLLIDKAAIKFIAASEAQANLVNLFIHKKEDQSVVIPFPVSNFYHYNEAKRSQLRLKNSLSEKIVLCYTGRLSLQKNVMALLPLFIKIKTIFPEAVLYLAGDFDDIGIPYRGFDRPFLSMKLAFEESLAEVPSKLRKDIFYLGNLNPSELNDLYHLSDMYLSLSTHNDEDFGMSPAEAAVLGLPLFLTDWGGFKNFKKNLAEYVYLTKVEMGKLHPAPGPGVVGDLLKFIAQSSKFNRQSIIDLSINYYSPNAIAQKIWLTLDKKADKFKGFNSYFKEVSLLSTLGAPFESIEHKYTEDYFKIYQSYLNPSSKGVK